MYFKYFIYLIGFHMCLSFVYIFKIYFLNKRFNIIFRKRSMFFSLIREEIVEKIADESNDLLTLKRLRFLLYLHIFLSITGKIILAILFILIFLIFLRI